jgi:hypothetical protein
MPDRVFGLDASGAERIRRVLQTVENQVIDPVRSGPDLQWQPEMRLVVTTTAVQPNNTTPLSVTRWTDTATTVLPTATTLSFTAFDWNGWGFEKNYKATAFRPLPAYKWYCAQPPAARYGVVSAAITTRGSSSVCDTVKVNPSTDCAGLGRDTETTFTINLPNRTGIASTLTTGDVVLYMPQLGGDLVLVSPYSASGSADIKWGKVTTVGVTTGAGSTDCDHVAINPSTDCSGAGTDTGTTISVILPRRAGIGPHLTAGDVISYVQSVDSKQTIVSDYSEPSSGVKMRWAKVNSTSIDADPADAYQCHHVNAWPSTDCDGSNLDTDTTITIYLPDILRADSILTTGDIVGYQDDVNGENVIATDFASPAVVLRISTLVASTAADGTPLRADTATHLWSCHTQIGVTATTSASYASTDAEWIDHTQGFCFFLNNRTRQDAYAGERDRYIGVRVGTKEGTPVYAIKDEYRRYPILVINLTGEEIPAFGVMQVFSGTHHSEQRIFNVTKAGADSAQIEQRPLLLNSEWPIPAFSRGWAAIPGIQPLPVLCSTARMGGGINYTGRRWYVDPTSENWALVSDSTIHRPPSARWNFININVGTSDENHFVLEPLPEVARYGAIATTLTIDINGCASFKVNQFLDCHHSTKLREQDFPSVGTAAYSTHTVYLPSTKVQFDLGVGDKVHYLRATDDNFVLINAAPKGSTATSILWAKATTHWTYSGSYPSTTCPTVVCNPCTDCDGNGVTTDTITLELPTFSNDGSQVRTDPNVETGNVIGYIQDAASDRIAVVGWDGDAIGSMKMWARSSLTSGIQQGWRVMDGSANASGAAGVKTGSGWDMRNFFPRGAGNTEYGVTSGSSVLTRDQLLHSHPMPNTPENVDINLDGATTFVTRFTTLCTGNPTQNDTDFGSSDTSLQSCGTAAWGPLPIMNPHRGVYFIERIDNSST